MKNNKEQAKQLKQLLALLAKEVQPAKEVKPVKATEIFKQLGLAIEALNTELSRSNSCDTRLEYLYNKINILENHL